MDVTIATVWLLTFSFAGPAGVTVGGIANQHECEQLAHAMLVAANLPVAPNLPRFSCIPYKAIVAKGE